MRCTGLWDGEIQGQTGQPSVREIDAHTMYNQWATTPGRSPNYPRPKSITHLHTFSDNGVYVALQLFLVNLVSDQWRWVLIPYSYLTCLSYMLGDDSPNIHGTNRFTWCPSHERHILQCGKTGFYTLQFGSYSRGSNPRPFDYHANVLPPGHSSLCVKCQEHTIVHTLKGIRHLPVTPCHRQLSTRHYLSLSRLFVVRLWGKDCLLRRCFVTQLGHNLSRMLNDFQVYYYWLWHTWRAGALAYCMASVYSCVGETVFSQNNPIPMSTGTRPSQDKYITIFPLISSECRR